MNSRIKSYLFVILLISSAYGSEFQVNTRTTLSQANADVAAVPKGGFAVTWSSYYSTIGRSNDIFCRIYEPNCSPVGDEFQVNKTTQGNQTEPSIAVKSFGEFVIAWQGPGAAQENDDIFAQLVNAKGLPIGDEFRVNNTITQNDQVCPKLDINGSGSLVIVWESETEPNSTIICCRRYDSGGTAIGDELQVSTSSDSRYPDVAIDPNGNFTIVWIEGKRPNYKIMARRYNSNGLSITEPFAVSTIKITSLSQPAIAMDAAGCSFITWDGDPNLAANDDIYARLYEPNGTPKGEQFMVNSTLEKAQQNPQVAINDSGQFIIAWDSDGDPNMSEKGIFCQRFNSSGQRLGDEFHLNSYTDSDQKYPAVTIMDNGQFVAVWQSNNQDGSGYGIFGKSEQMISAADFNIDGYINFADYSLLAKEWRKTDSSLFSDLIKDDTVNSLDLFAFCQNWLEP